MIRERPLHGKLDHLADQLAAGKVGAEPAGLTLRTVVNEAAALEARAAELKQTLECFLDWFDTRFPKGAPALPGLSLFSVAERARAAVAEGRRTA